MQIDVLGPAEFNAAIPRLGEILADAVASGAGVSFLLPFSPQSGEAYWHGLSDAVASGGQTILVAATEARLLGPSSSEGHGRPTSRIAAKLPNFWCTATIGGAALAHC